MAGARAGVGGRPTVATKEAIRAAPGLLPDPGQSVTSLAKLLGVSLGALHLSSLRQ
ncbi:hypothetical protein ACFW6X_13900 [Streptomyces bacillaris]|uniref:hypothetical protein n=1 Tax=Streptomyces bacillaris TaxID=68179 RepID=UPI0036A90640